MIDDHPVFRSGVASLINQIPGFEVSLQADNGVEFIEQLSGDRVPDIVLLDLNMPIMDGYQTAGWIRQHLPGVKTMVLTMVDHDFAIIKMLNLGARGFLLKRCSIQELQIALSQVRDLGFCLNESFTPYMTTLTQKDKEQQIRKQNRLIPTEREVEFLKLVCTDMTYRGIAGVMCVSSRTAEGYRDALFKKLDVDSRVGLVLYAIRSGIVML